MGVYLYPSGTETELKNAYIGDYQEIYYIDLKNQTKAAIEAEWFSVYEYGSVQYTSSWFAVWFVYKTVDLADVSKVTITVNWQWSWSSYWGVFWWILQGSMSNVYSKSLAWVKNFSSVDWNKALFVSYNDWKQTKAWTGGVSWTFKVEFIVDFTTNIATCNLTWDSTASWTYNFSSYATTVKSTYNNIGAYTNSQTSIVWDFGTQETQ